MSIINTEHVWTVLIEFDVNLRGDWDDDNQPRTRAIHVVAESSKEAMEKASRYASEELYGHIGKLELLCEEVWVR